MDLESARNFGRRRDELQADIDNYKPSATGHEHLSSQERFNQLGKRVEALSGHWQWDEAYSPTRSWRFSDGVELKVILGYERPDEYGNHTEGQITSIDAHWLYGDILLARECMASGSAGFPTDPEDTARVLGSLEETVKAAEDIEAASSPQTNW